MAIKIGVILLFVLGVALAGLLFVVAGFLFFAPETLIGTLRVGMAVGCVAGGALLLIPILVFAILYFSSTLLRTKEKKNPPTQDGGAEIS